MPGAIVLTDGATFKCAHMVAAIGKPFVSISTVASKIKVDVASPILSGATIGGFTTVNGCTFQVTGTPTPCISFILTAPATGALQQDGIAVYTQADLSAILTVVSTGNANPGLVISESQQKLLV